MLLFTDFRRFCCWMAAPACPGALICIAARHAGAAIQQQVFLEQGYQVFGETSNTHGNKHPKCLYLSADFVRHEITRGHE
jgi:hypothetical protein